MVEINVLIAALLRGICFSFNIQNKRHTNEKIVTPYKGGYICKFMLLNLRYPNAFYFRHAIRIRYSLNKNVCSYKSCYP
jgi:hypothetical protein